MNTAAKPKFRRRAEARPDEILDAALAVFTEKGFDAARVDDIAAAASLSKGAVYLYFDSKEALLRGLIDREVAPVADRLKGLAAAGGDDPKAAMTMIVTFATALINEARMFATPKLVLTVAPRFKEIAAFYRKRVFDEAIGAIASLHRSGVRSGVFRDADSDTVARMVVGPIIIAALRRHMLGAEDLPPVEPQHHLELLFKGLEAR